VSRYGMIAFASSLDQAGVLTQTAEDAALLLEAMAGFDDRDSTSLDDPVPPYSQLIREPWDGVTIGVPESFFDDGLDADNAAAVRAALAELEKLGATPPSVHAHPPLGARVLRGRSGRGVVEPVAFRRRALRPSRRERGQRSHGVLHAQSRRGVRRRGQAPHLDRHLVLSAGYFDAYYRKHRRLASSSATTSRAHSATSTSSRARRRRRRRSA
jgi:aspartyl-tRNA(Asn)/glutamyl-tRNA(Gln) amidotransferase subunit A